MILVDVVFYHLLRVSLPGNGRHLSRRCCADLSRTLNLQWCSADPEIYLWFLVNKKNWEEINFLFQRHAALSCSNIINNRRASVYPFGCLSVLPRLNRLPYLHNSGCMDQPYQTPWPLPCRRYSLSVHVTRCLRSTSCNRCPIEFFGLASGWSEFICYHNWMLVWRSLRRGIPIHKWFTTNSLFWTGRTWTEGRTSIKIYQDSNITSHDDTHLASTFARQLNWFWCPHYRGKIPLWDRKPLST